MIGPQQIRGDTQTGGRSPVDFPGLLLHSFSFFANIEIDEGKDITPIDICSVGL